MLSNNATKNDSNSEAYGNNDNNTAGNNATAWALGKSLNTTANSNENETSSFSLPVKVIFFGVVSLFAIMLVFSLGSYIYGKVSRRKRRKKGSSADTGAVSQSEDEERLRSLISMPSKTPTKLPEAKVKWPDRYNKHAPTSDAPPPMPPP